MKIKVIAYTKPL